MKFKPIAKAYINKLDKIKTVSKGTRCIFITKLGVLDEGKPWTCVKGCLAEELVYCFLITLKYSELIHTSNIKPYTHSEGGWKGKRQGSLPIDE